MIISSTNKKFLGFIDLEAGISNWNATAALYSSLISISIINFMSFAQPYLMLDVLHLPQEAIGRYTGYLTTWNELLGLCLAVLIGVWADRVGRRILYVIGVSLVGLGYLGLTVVQSIVDYTFYRSLMGIGSVLIGTMLGLILVDYPKESSRGKWTGINAVLNGIGILIVAFGVSKLPALFEEKGYATSTAMQLTLLFMAAWCAVTAIILRLGLITAISPTASKEKKPIKQVVLEGVDAGKRNSKVLLAYGCFVVSRSDLIVLSTFFTLWIQDYSRNQGMPAAEAIATAGAMFAMIQGVSLIWAPLFGIMLDKLDRVFCVVFALLTAGMSYMLLAAIGDPNSSSIYLLCALVGIGQISIILSTQSLIGQEAPKERRGTVMGIATACGSFGLMTTSFFGGFLYDMWMPTAPLMVFGGLNIVLLVGALLIWKKYQFPVRLAEV